MGVPLRHVDIVVAHFHLLDTVERSPECVLDGTVQRGAAHRASPRHESPRQLGVACFVSRDASQETKGFFIGGPLELLRRQERPERFSHATFFDRERREIGE